MNDERPPIAAAREKIGDLQCLCVWHEAASEQITSGKPSAVVILCHGFGAGGDDLAGCAVELLTQDDAIQDALFILPAAPIELAPAGIPGYDSRAWWPLDMELIQSLMAEGKFRELKNDSPEDLSRRRKSILEIMEILTERFGLPYDKIVLGGFSQGSMLMTDVALNSPEPVGGLIAWSGTLLNEQEWREAAERKSEDGTVLSVFQSHGLRDPILPYAGAEALRDMLLERKHDVRFVEFNGEHQIPPVAIDGAAELIKSVIEAKVEG